MCVTVPILSRHRRGREGDDVEVVLVWSTGLSGSPPGLLVGMALSVVVALGT